MPGSTGGWLYAAGDVNHRALLTHQGKYQARIAGAAIAARAAGGGRCDDAALGRARRDRRPRGGAAGGLHRPRGRRGRPDRGGGGEPGAASGCVDYDLGKVAGAACTPTATAGRPAWSSTWTADSWSGVTFVGPGVAELLHSATVAVVGEVPVDRLWHAVPAYPTISEVWLRLLETYRG